MYTLYIDTHFVQLVLALYQDNKVIGMRKLDSNEHSKNTIPMLEELLNEFHIEVKDLNLVIVITGPGSFTGVRIGVVIAKMIGFTCHVPIKAISYLEAMAVSTHTPINVGIKDRNGVFVGEFDSSITLKKDYYYLSNEDYQKINLDIQFDVPIDFLAIKKYLDGKKEIEPHLLTPLYVKKLEVGK